MSLLADPAFDFLLLVIFTLVAPAFYLSWIRKTERYHTEAWGPLVRAFVYGAVIGTFISAILEAIFSDAFSAIVTPDLGLPTNANLGLVVLACIAAPFIEEGMKGLGVYGMRDQVRFIADGLVFGAAIGFGFSFVENILYGASAWVAAGGGFAAAIATVLVRSVSSSLLHGSATSMTGYGVALDQAQKGKGHAIAPYYLLAVLMHASFNFLASITIILPLLGVPLSTAQSNDLAVVALLLAIVYGFTVFGYARRKVGELQFRSVTGPSTPTTGPATAGTPAAGAGYAVRRN